MFNKLRNRFLLMNLVITSTIMLVAFGSIYTITYRNVHGDIGMELRKTADIYRKSDGPAVPPFGGGGGPRQDGERPGFADDGDPRPERSVSFAVETDGQWLVTKTDSRFDQDSSFYALAVEKAAAKPTDYGQFTLDGTRWAYDRLKTAGGYSIVFMDVTARQEILTNLIYTFGAAAVVMLGMIYLASRYFAGRSIAPVQEAFEKQKRFIADASHELKTPLAVINTNADVLLANEEDTIRAQSQWLQRIKSETERMKKLTNDLLYLTEMDDARDRVIHVPLDLSEAVESVILTMEAVIYEHDLALDYDIEPGISVIGSAEQLKQVVMILLDNAVKYAGGGGAVSLALQRRQGHVLLSVSNTGPGISPEHLDKIFDRFYRADPSRSRQHGGYGLGLAIAKSIVQQHRGKIYAKSVPGEKTTFYVQLG